MKKTIATTLATLAVLTTALAGCAPSTSTADDNDLGLIEPGVLRIGTDGITNPFTIVDGDTVTGFDNDLMGETAERMDLKPEYVVMEFGSILPAVSNNQLDTAAAVISVTDERKKSVDFSDGYFYDSYAYLVKEGLDIESEDDLKSGWSLCGAVPATRRDVPAHTAASTEGPRRP